MDQGIETLFISECREKFLENIQQLENPARFEKRAISKRRLQEWINLIDNRETNQYYYYVQHFFITQSELFDIEGRKVVPLEEMFDTCIEIHKEIGYQGRNGMETEVKKMFSNITREMVTRFLMFTNNCQEYIEMKNRYKAKNKTITRPDRIEKKVIVLNLIDMQNNPDGDFKWILNAHNMSTGLCHFRALKTNSAVDIVQTLCEIFHQHGEPTILKLCNLNILQEFKVLQQIWPELVIEEESSMESNDQRTQSNTSVLNILQSCVSELNIDNWSFLIGYVQNKKNKSNSIPLMQHSQATKSSSLQNPGAAIIDTDVTDMAKSQNNSPNTDIQPSTPGASRLITDPELNAEQHPIPSPSELFDFHFEDIDWEEILDNIQIESFQLSPSSSHSNIQYNAYSKPTKSFSQMFTDYQKLSKKISLLMWKLNRNILSYAFLKYTIKTAKEDEHIDCKGYHLEIETKCHSLLSLRRRLLRRLNRVQPLTKSNLKIISYFEIH